MESAKDGALGGGGGERRHLALVLAGWLVGPRLRRGGAVPGHAVLILPLEVRGQAEGADYVGRAFAEALAVNLAGAKELRVLPVPASGPGKQADALAPSRTATESGAGRVLTGSLTRRADKVLASVSLLDAAENRLVWGTQIEMPEAEMTALASALAREVAKQLGVGFGRLYDTPASALRRSDIATSPLATEALGTVERHEIKAAVEATARLVEAFPDKPEAHALRVEALQEAWHSDPSPANEKAIEKALASLARLDPEHPLAEIVRGFVQSGKGEARESIPRFTRILARSDLTPDLRSHALMLRGWNERDAGDHDASFRDLEEALRLTPTDARVFAVLAESLRTVGRPEEALVRARQAVTLSPSDPEAQIDLAFALGALERWSEAAAAAGRACELAPSQVNCASYAVVLLGAGPAAEARDVAERASKLTEQPGGDYNLACFWARVGERSKALRYLRRALELGYDNPFIADDPDLASLHHDPGFEALVAEVKKHTRKD